ncbi:MAG: HAD-IA family hydrolase [Verrucomicrobiales bacterium]|nr:HAD-IA family hydrolase [Verrucomicrobiales bacterium]
MLRRLIFDFDGLIADTESAIYAAWRELYQSQGHDLAVEQYVQCVGSTFLSFDPMAALEKLVGHSVDWEPLLRRKDARIREMHRQMDTLPGVRTLLAEANSHGVECAVASSSEAAWLFPWLERLGIRQHFRHICCRDDTARAKPAPDLFLLAMDKLGVGPDESLVLEDSANGLKAAVAAGVPCIVVPNAITRHSDFSQAAAILPSLEGRTLRELSDAAAKPLLRGNI